MVSSSSGVSKRDVAGSQKYLNKSKSYYDALRFTCIIYFIYSELGMYIFCFYPIPGLNCSTNWKPLSKYKFYLDVKNQQTAKKIETKIKEFGGVSSFCYELNYRLCWCS